MCSTSDLKFTTEAITPPDSELEHIFNEGKDPRDFMRALPPFFGGSSHPEQLAETLFRTWALTDIAHGLPPVAILARDEDRQPEAFSIVFYRRYFTSADGQTGRQTTIPPGPDSYSLALLKGELQLVMTLYDGEPPAGETDALQDPHVYAILNRFADALRPREDGEAPPPGLTYAVDLPNAASDARSQAIQTETKARLTEILNRLLDRFEQPDDDTPEARESKERFPINGESRTLTANPWLPAVEAFLDPDKSHWILNKAHNSIDYNPKGDAKVVPFYKNQSDGIMPANVFSDSAACAAWFGLTHSQVKALGEFEYQLLTGLQHHFIRYRTEHEKDAWAYIDLPMLAAYMNVDFNACNHSDRARWGAAFDRVLQMQLRGTFTEYTKGRNAPKKDFYETGPLIFATVLRTRTREDKNGQPSLMVDYPVAIRYNLGSRYEDYLKHRKAQDTLLPIGILTRNADKDKNIIRLTRAWVFSFRIDDRKQGRGVIAGWTIKDHLSKARVDIPDWVESAGRYSQFRTVALKWMEEAAKDVGASLQFLHETGKPLDDPLFDLQRGKTGFNQWLSRICRVVPKDVPLTNFLHQLDSRRNVAALPTGRRARSRKHGARA